MQGQYGKKFNRYGCWQAEIVIGRSKNLIRVHQGSNANRNNIIKSPRNFETI
ncbi:hypothetical protein Hanom_Chr06g00510201 [Helianthus anomalus]